MSKAWHGCQNDIRISNWHKNDIKCCLGHFIISQYFLFPLGLKKEKKISYQKSIFSLWQFALFNTKSALKMKGGGSSRGKHAHVRGVGWPMLFLRAKRTPSDGVINYIFRKIFPPISNPATRVAPRKRFLCYYCVFKQ